MKFLQTPGFVIAGFILAVGFNLPHMVEVYESVSNTALPDWYSWGMMIVIEFGVLVLAVNNRPWAASAFAWLIFAINVYHYLHDWPGWVEAIAGVLFSSVPAFFIWYFADLFSDMVREQKKREREQSQMNVQKPVQKPVHVNVQPVVHRKKPSVQPRKKVNKSSATPEQMREYIEQYVITHSKRPSVRHLSEKLGVSVGTISNWNKKINQA